MLGLIQITSWHWAGFILCILIFLALDLGVFHRKAHVVSFKEALAWTGLWVTLAMLFGLVIAPALVHDWQLKQTVEFITGYVIELSLSMDNVFVIAIIFAHFDVPDRYQHRVLFWGILGALVMRGLMIWLGVELIHRFEWLLIALGAFLVFSGLRMVFTREKESDPEKNIAVRLTRKFFPVSTEFDGQKFLTIHKGRSALTPLALVLVLVETTDLIFALDSIPAIFAITKDAFIVFTSNVFAILGLRSLYFVLAGAIQYFRYLKIGLSIVLVFIGLKMVLVDYVHIPTPLSLGVVVLIIAGSILLSVKATHREKA
ncbi:MAG: TerC family protein [Verrucomicrobiales bacterium]|nr:TerC family protein [Verrucomicrobiales bacterium]